MRFDMLERTIAGAVTRQLLLAVTICAFVVGGLGGVAAYAEISGAVIGIGKLVTQGRVQKVQHPDGGVVGEILVRDGQMVEAGDVLFRLDGTRARASLGVIDSQLDQLLVQEARLLAEQARAERIDFSGTALSSGDGRAATLRRAQEELMAARRETREGRKEQLGQQIAQYGEQITALEAERAALDESLALLEEQVADTERLHELGLVVDSELIAIRREKASLLGNQASISAEIVEVHQAVSRTRLEIAQVEEEFHQGVLTELDEKRVEIARLREERMAALDRLDHLEIRAPVTGQLHELDVHTVGGVIPAGETLVSIVPADERLVVEARLKPQDIDQVTAGQSARLRLSGLDMRVTPQLPGVVSDVSGDLTEDPATGQSFYTATVEIDEAALADLENADMRPGMPVEVFFETRSRTIMSYLIEPITDQVRHALRES